jgi:uncharacterized protein
VKGLLLAPGAGAGADQPSLVAIDRETTSLGLTVERVDFPYRLAGRSRPDPPAVLAATISDAAQALAARLRTETAQLVLGGRSMGGRICSQVVAAGLPAVGLALISYPLHPPGRLDRMRTAHFPDLKLPCLFVSGTRDAFGTPDELTAATSAIAGSVTHVWIDGGDHSLRRRDDLVATAVAEWISRLGPA